MQPRPTRHARSASPGWLPTHPHTGAHARPPARRHRHPGPVGVSLAASALLGLLAVLAVTLSPRTALSADSGGAGGSAGSLLGAASGGAHSAGGRGAGAGVGAGAGAGVGALRQLLATPADPSQLTLLAPTTVTAGHRLTLTLRVRSASGVPVADGLVEVWTQAGSHQPRRDLEAVRTNAAGSAAVPVPGLARSSRFGARFRGLGADLPSLVRTALVRVSDPSAARAASQARLVGTVAARLATAPASQLAEAILADPRVIPDGTDVSTDLQDAAAGRPGSSGAPVSAAILRLILAVGTTHTVTISAIESGGEGHCYQGDVSLPESACPGDAHYRGLAVDFTSLDGQVITGRNAPALTIMAIAERVLPPGSAFGQSDCGLTPPLPAGWTTFPDACDHLHVQV